MCLPSPSVALLHKIADVRVHLAVMTSAAGRRTRAFRVNTSPAPAPSVPRVDCSFRSDGAIVDPSVGSITSLDLGNLPLLVGVGRSLILRLPNRVTVLRRPVGVL